MLHVSSSKIYHHFWGLLTNRWALACFGLITFQQIIEASSTIWLVIMTKEIVEGEYFFFYLSLYLLSLALPYLPGCFAYIIKTSWKQDSQRTFIHTFIQSNQNQISEWSNQGIKEEKLSILSNEGPNALHALIDYVFDLYGYVISVFLSILALSVVVEPLFGIAYGISVLMVMCVMQIKRRLQRHLTKKALTARVDLCQSLLAAWDNILLGNRYNFKLWKQKTSQRMERCLKKNVDLERFDQILAIVISLLTVIPSFIVVIYYAYMNRTDVVNLTAFAVTLPVLFTILSYTYQTLSLIFKWGMHKSKLSSIYRVIQPNHHSHLEMEKKIKWQKIHMSHSTFSSSKACLSLKGPTALMSHKEIIEYTQRAGRITLRGENGSGKSTLLMLIKHHLSDRAFFLPTQTQLSFHSQTHLYSTGESLRSRLLEIIECVDVDVLLLDEWDANLDTQNQEKISGLIDQLAQKKCVIEVRHR